MGEINSPDSVNFIVFDGEASTWVWDFIGSYMYTNHQPQYRSALNLDNFLEARDYHQS